MELNWWWPDAALNSPSTNSGLAGVLAGEISLENAILHSSNPNFSIIPAGRMAIADRPVLARSARLKEILKTLSKQYEHLILDIPALSTTNDAIPLASLGEACILVINHGVTSVDKVRLALDDIDHLKMLGVVLNKVKLSTPSRIMQMIPQDSVPLTDNTVS